MSLRGIEAGLAVEANQIIRSNEVLYSDKAVPLYELVKRGFEANNLLIKDASKFNQGYLRWQQVRYLGIPLNPNIPNDRVTCKTGLEGYFYNELKTRDQLVRAILQIGQQTWESIQVSGRYSPTRKKKFKETILGTGYTDDAVIFWHSVFGSILARLRVKLLYNPEAKKFQMMNRQDNGSRIDFKTNSDGRLIQNYVLPINNICSSEIEFIPKNADEELWWQTMQNIGIFGHPLVRSLLKEIYK